MGELPKQLLAWLAKLLPKQKVQGDRAVQIGRVDGDLSTDHSTHHHTTRFAQSGCVGAGAVHTGPVQNVTQVHQHFYPPVETERVMPPSSAAPPAPAPAPVPPATVRTATTVAQVLALMDLLPDPVRFKVLDFMREEFGTAMVIELQPHQLYRTRRYVETIHQQTYQQPIRHNARKQQ